MKEGEFPFLNHDEVILAVAEGALSASALSAEITQADYLEFKKVWQIRQTFANKKGQIWWHILVYIANPEYKEDTYQLIEIEDWGDEDNAPDLVAIKNSEQPIETFYLNPKSQKEGIYCNLVWQNPNEL